MPTISWSGYKGASLSDAAGHEQGTRQYAYDIRAGVTADTRPPVHCSAALLVCDACITGTLWCFSKSKAQASGLAPLT